MSQSTTVMLEWPRHEGRALTAGPVSLAVYAGHELHLVLESGEMALVLIDHEVRGILMDGGHEIRVVEQGQGAGSREPSRVRALQASASLLLLRCGQPIPLPQAGIQVCVADPVRFYDSFLRNSEELTDTELGRVLETLAQSHSGEESSLGQSVGLRTMRVPTAAREQLPSEPASVAT